MGEKAWTVLFHSKGVSDDYYKSIIQARKYSEKIPSRAAVTIGRKFSEPFDGSQNFYIAKC